MPSFILVGFRKFWSDVANLLFLVAFSCSVLGEICVRLRGVMKTKANNLDPRIAQVLASITDPYLGTNLLEAGVLHEFELTDSMLKLHLQWGFAFSDYPSERQEKLQQLLQAQFPSHTISLHFDWRINRHRLHNSAKGLTGVKNIIAVGSGKGGVGKSTTTVNLALALQADGAKVGVLDADIYGPNQPILLGIHQKPEVREDKQFIPVERFGLQTLSMGYLIDQHDPVVWRGPMISKAFEQLLFETAWTDLDYLLIDLPPGTGDIQLTLTQKMPAVGAVIVTTPQALALADVRKAVAMFEKATLPVLGIVENMGIHQCSHCGHLEPIFGDKGGENLASEHGITFLGQLPLDRRIRESADCGQPIVLAEPDSHITREYREIARQMSAQLSLCARDYNLTSSVVVTT